MRKPPLKPAAPVPVCAACSRELDAAIDGHRLQARFRPLAEFARCDIFGYLASVRGPAGTVPASFGRLAKAAMQLGRLRDFACEAAAVAARRFAETNGKGLLFVPVPESALEHAGPALADDLAAAVAGRGNCQVGRVAIVLPAIEDMRLEAGVEFATRLRAAGFGLASSCFGCSLDHHRLWTRVAPDFILLDEFLFDGVDLASLRGTPFYEQLAAAIGDGRRVVADGIRSSSDFSMLQQLGIAYGAGDFIGRANAVPTRALSAAAHKTIAGACDCRGGRPSASGGVLERLIDSSLPVAPETHSEDVFALFERNPEMRAVAVVTDGMPLGLISRYEMIDNMARPFRHELYGRKPCTRFMDAQPLMVEIGVSLGELADIVVGADPRHLIGGFVITDRGRYLGIGSVQELVREVTAMQMEAAKYANPLTQLPGNVPINQHIDNMLDAGVPFCIAYCDLDHFKPFNDVYGYAKGDEVIQLTARVLAVAGDAERDFVGHIGGDDFVVVFVAEDWETRCQAALAAFGTQILAFFSHDDIERGGYVTENRKGQMEFHRLTSLSIGAVEVAPGMFRNHLQVSQVAAEVKKRAKSISGNSLFINRRQYPHEAAGAAGESAPAAGTGAAS